MERRLHRLVYLVQISLLLLAGCAKKEVTSPPPPPREEKPRVFLKEAHFLHADKQGHPVIEIWANEAEGEENSIYLKGVKCHLFKNGKVVGAISAPSALYAPKDNLLSFQENSLIEYPIGVNSLRCSSLKVNFKEKRMEGKTAVLKWGEMKVKGAEVDLNWTLKKGIFKKAMIKIERVKRL